MSTQCAICYVSDLNFFLPSLVSASGIRRFVAPHQADIFIFTVGVDGEKIAAANRMLKDQGMQVLAIEDRVFSEIDKDRLERTRTPMAMFGRLFMQDLLPSACQRIVYLDGDTWIMGDPTALIEAVVPEGRFAAAEDTIFYRQKFPIGGTTREIRHYFSQLGLTPQQGYFNSGVFATSRATWKSISQEAYRYYIANAAICEHSPDQSALNAIIGDRRLRLSNRWNFQTQLKIWGAERYFAPVIAHFNRYPKPWMGVCAPWTAMHAQYQQAIAPFAALNLPLKTLNAEEMAQFNASTLKSYAYLQWPGVSRLALQAMGFAAMERRAWM